MAKRLDTEIIINLAGNLTAKARQYGANMSEFARRNERAMSVVKATSAAAGRGLDMLGNRYTGMIAGFAGGAMLNNYKQLDRRLTRMGITAGKTREEIAEIFNLSQDVAIKFRVDTSEIQGASEVINTRTGDLDFALKNRENIGMAIAGSGASGEDIGGLIAEYKKLLILTEKEVGKALGGMNELGKTGAFELNNAAKLLPPAISMYSAAGASGIDAAMEVMAVAEAAMDLRANDVLAASTVTAFIRDLQSPNVLKSLKANGIRVFDKDGKIRSLPQILDETAQRSSRNGVEKQGGYLSGAGFGQESMDLIKAVSGQTGREKLKAYMGVVPDEKSLLEDAKYAAQDFTSALQSMTTTWEKFANSQLAAPVQDLADALNSVDQETVQNWLEIGKNVALATGGFLAARKAFQIGKGAYDFLRPGKKGIPAGVADVFGSGVMPVYVTNMGVGGMGNGGPGVPDLPGSNKSKYDKGGVLGMAINTASEITSLVPFPKNDEERAALIKRAQDNSNRKTMWDDIKKWLTAPPVPPSSPQWDALHPNMMGTYPYIPQPLQQLQGEIEVTVKDDRVQVSKVKINTPGVTMSAQTGISNVEQD
ncbi:minor tail protein|uniref:Minor tail protein n=1 Tax=Brenneria salicis ATCC 15712 = DSM 30166 TaxID=714314 RepID=A0A366I7B2_9GAMM|nr:phage tail tape measure protein [Brenneria salicis]NMN90526.1 minor tail protein [Brenneria salicis ATCC 15712 = DSM 30166]RBP64856.1 minor tail protein [Brenneria salicis ATCC 15712 = DSM 30166]RLM31575.1 phage tail protein [Brenneria salicis ATCC 15712 = DSM 30166]